MIPVGIVSFAYFPLLRYFATSISATAATAVRKGNFFPSTNSGQQNRILRQNIQ